MEQTKGKAIVIKPNNWQTQLIKNSKVVLREISRLSPDKFETTQIERQKLTDQLDTLQKSRTFFAKEYTGDDGKKHLKNIEAEITKLNHQIAIIPESLTIGLLSVRNYDDLEDSLILILNDLRLFFQVDNMISTDGLYSLCDLIVSEYRNLKLEEVAMCMSKAKKGEYGQLFNRLDGAIIMGWLQKYNEDRQQRIADRNYVQQSHCKIGLNEGRQTFRGDHAHLVNQAYAMVALNSGKKTGKK